MPRHRLACAPESTSAPRGIDDLDAAGPMPLGGGPSHHLGVVVEGEPGVRVAEQSLSCLHVHAGCYEPGGVRELE
jgi:hypothetical protein